MLQIKIIKVRSHNTSCRDCIYPNSKIKKNEDALCIDDTDPRRPNETKYFLCTKHMNNFLEKCKELKNMR